MPLRDSSDVARLVRMHHRRRGWAWVAVGYLSKSGVDVTWGSQVTLGQPFPVREPVWAWGTGRNLVSGYGSAIALIIVGLFFNGITLLLLFALVMIVRHTRLRRSQQMPMPNLP